VIFPDSKRRSKGEMKEENDNCVRRGFGGREKKGRGG
jgi:hypothetical protein